jgi:hypothetical protein
MDFRLSPREVWLSTLIFAIIACLLLIPLLFLFSDERFSVAGKSIALGSAIFWGIMTLLFMGRYWQIYYRFFYPDWMRSISPLNILLYAAIGMGLWGLTLVFENRLILGFALLGGLEGVAEHVFAVYGLHVLEKVPWLEGLKPFPVILFSFFEYIAYWSAAAWLGLLFTHLLP